MRRSRAVGHSSAMTDLSPANDRSISYPMTGNGGDEPGLVSSLFSISKSTRAFLALLLSEIGLHPGQDQLLARLEMGRPVSVSALADLLAVRPSTVSKMLDRLIEKGLVRRSSSDGDARRTMVLLTETGKDMQICVHALWRRLEVELVSAMPSTEHQKLAEALTQVETILISRLRRLR